MLPCSDLHPLPAPWYGKGPRGVSRSRRRGAETRVYRLVYYGPAYGYVVVDCGSVQDVVRRRRRGILEARVAAQLAARYPAFTL